jgi:PAS domain S-box-containing protein
MIVFPKLEPGWKRGIPTSPLDRPDTPLWRFTFISSGFLLLAMGLLGLLTWMIGEPLLTQFVPAFPPLHYNGAIGHALWGGAYVSLGRGRYRAANWLAMTLVSWGLVLLSVNALVSVNALDVPFENWTLGPLVSTFEFPPAGLSTELAVAFCLGSAAVVLSARRKVRALHLFVPAAIGLILAVAGPVLFVTHSAGVLVRPTGPSILSMVGIAIAGLALLTSACRRGLPTFALGYLIPLTVGALGVGVTFVLWLALNEDQNRRIHRQVQFESANLQRLTRNRLAEYTNAIATQAEEWPNSTPEKRKEHIGSYVGRLPGCLGVARIDENLDLTWVESILPAGLPQTIGELGVGDALISAVREGRNAALRPPRSNWRGARVLILYSPHRNAKSGLISVIRVQELFSAIINASVIPGYAVAISEKEGTIFSRYNSERMHQDRWSQTLPLNYEKLGWQLTVWPAQEAMERESLSLPKLALTLGLLTTGLLALAVHLAQTARLRTFALENEVRERELAQRALAQSEEKYRTLIDNLGQAIFLQDREHRYIAANRQFCKSIGREESEIFGTTEADLFEPQRAATLSEDVRTVLAEGKTVETEEDTLNDGRRTCIRRVLTPVRDVAGQTTGVLGICWDVTEQRQLEVHVHQASKMDAIGQLAGGIAHDFNNLLTVILGNLELMLLNFYAGDANRDLATSARNAAARATSLTQRLLGFSRRHQLDWSPTD